MNEYRHSFFEPANLLDLYDWHNDQVHQGTAICQVNSKNRPLAESSDETFYKSSYELYEFLGINGESKLSAVSKIKKFGPKNSCMKAISELISPQADLLNKRNMKKVVKNDVGSYKQIIFPESKLDVDYQQLDRMKRKNKSVTHVVSEIEYSIFELIIYEDKFYDEDEVSKKRLNRAHENFLKNQRSSNKSFLSKLFSCAGESHVENNDVKIDFFDSVTQKLKKDIEEEDLINLSNDLLKRKKRATGTTIKFQIMPINDFLRQHAQNRIIKYTDELQSFNQTENNLRYMTKHVFDLRQKLSTVYALQDNKYSILNKRLGLPVTLSSSRDLEILKVSEKMLSESLYEAQSSIIKYRQSCDISVINKYLNKHKNTIEVSDKNIQLIKKGLPGNAPKPNKEINILLLGESGVGKSTFVNAYYNYLKFNTLDEATKHESLRSLICSTFSYTDNQYNIKTVTIKQNPDQGEGEAEDDDTVDAVANEVFIPGLSSTQHAKSYKFMKDDMLIRIIDTPGIGDSRGVKMDQKNFKNTIQYISKLTHLNAICILLKPNIKRMELQTRYCIKELFSHLNKVSIKNIIFCFTNTRSTSFRPGDTLPSLQAFIRDEIEAHSGVKVPLSEDNIICVDNEAFRYLVLTKEMKNDPLELAKFDVLDQYPSFVRSWDVSKTASEKLIKYAVSLPLLNIKEVVSYNQSKNLSVDFVEKLIQKILLTTHDFQAPLSFRTKKLIEKIASISFAMMSLSVTIFNDQFDAIIQEKILKLQSSLDNNDFLKVQFLETVRVYYKEVLRTYFEYTDYVCDLDTQMADSLKTLNA